MWRQATPDGRESGDRLRPSEIQKTLLTDVSARTRFKKEKLDSSFIAGTIFTGGLNSVTRGHVIDFSAPENQHLQTSKSGLVCWMRGCDEICQDCYLDCVGSNGGGNCPGCKEPYKDLDRYEEKDYDEFDEEDRGGRSSSTSAQIGQKAFIGEVYEAYEPPA
ncbi:unnamed protein product [Linum tenue]|uniref:Uncharacterized protein n=1 Tax=Linum tenue TaxID=586396 RepID=A0AAV0NN84_9ROSI|nr:unnamed protein product [Linum tenue]